jgi:hypothetical protein
VKPKGHRFEAHLKYTFSRYRLEMCTQCNKPRDEHVDGKCIFESTIFKSHELMDFFELLLKSGGTLSITAGKHTMTQKIKAHSTNQTANGMLGDIRSDGDAFLEEK